MSGKPSDDTTGQVRPEVDGSDEKVEIANQNEKEVMPSPQEEEAAIKKKYGGIVPRKPALIAKDHERAYFDSADWALGKEDTLKNLKGRLKHSDQNCSLLNSKHVRVDFFMLLLTTKRVLIHRLKMQARTRNPMRSRTINDCF
ncbi:hypothetical protein DAI22_05g265500 [Oryza sativa Japonica Group]|nr:hypothetical protein DAI22_05g265500 [Oryza sativa Japonica Group]